MPIHLQAKLLKVLDSSLIRRVGGTVYQKVDVRIIAATNSNLAKMVSEGKFREDLYYRINVLQLTVPPLRERPEDILLIAENYLKKLNIKYGYSRKISAKTMEIFTNYYWPGNIRQLKNVIERLVITNDNDDIDIGSMDDVIATDFIEYQREQKLQASSLQSDGELPFEGTLKDVMRNVREKYIHQTVESCGGSITLAAKKLGVHRTALYK